MDEAESLYYYYLSLGQYSDIAVSSLLFSFILVVATLVIYIALIEGDNESKNAARYFKVAKMIGMISLALFLISASALLYFLCAKSFIKVEIEKQCIKADSSICEKKLK